MAGNPPLTAEKALEIRELAHRTPIYLSPNGRWIGYTVRVPEHAESVKGQTFSFSGVFQELIGSEVHVRDLENKTDRTLTDEWGSSWAAGWSPDGNILLFLSDKGGEVHAWVWEAEKKQNRPLCDAPIRSFFGYDVPLWMPDGNKILIKQKIEVTASSTTEDQQTDPSIPSPSVTVFTSDDVSQLMEEPLSPRLTPAGNRVPVSTDRHLYDLALVDLQTGSAQMLAEGFRGGAIVLSHDGSRVAVLSVSSEDPRTRRRAHELYLIQVEKRAVQLVSQDILPPEGAQCLSWSPDNGKLAVISSGDLLVYEMDTDCLKRITEGIQLHHPSGPPLWNSKGTCIYYISQGQLYRISVVDNQVEILNEDTERIIVSFVRRNAIQVIYEDQGVLLQTLNSETGYEGIYLFDEKSDTVCLWEGDAHIGGMSIRDVQLAHYTDCTADRRQIVYIHQRADTSPDIWLADASFEDRRRVTAINQHLNHVHFGRTEFINYVLPDGESRKAVLLLPHI